MKNEFIQAKDMTMALRSIDEPFLDYTWFLKDGDNSLIW